jgi:hypothetical protein
VTRDFIDVGDVANAVYPATVKPISGIRARAMTTADLF